MSNHKILDRLHRKYLAMVAVDFSTDLGNIDEGITLELQREMLQRTIQHDISRVYPPSIAYRKSFIRNILEKLESSNVEILEDYYEEYASLMMDNDTDGMCFKTYVMPECSITLKESQCLISDGTTGLRTWQASHYFSEWILQNKHLLENRRILELGSGQGLVGLLINKTCHPSRYIFSDNHEQVLQKLAANIALNFSSCVHGTNLPNEPEISDGFKPESSLTDHYKLCEKCRYSTSLIHSCTYTEICDKYWCLLEKGVQNSYNHLHLSTKKEIELCHLDWENYDKENIVKCFNDVDLIVATDIVYDPCIVQALVDILYTLLNRKLQDSSIPVAYIASTYRNPQTRDIFLEALDSAKIKRTEIDGPQGESLFYRKEVQMHILKLQIFTDG